MILKSNQFNPREQKNISHNSYLLSYSFIPETSVTRDALTGAVLEKAHFPVFCVLPEPLFPPGSQSPESSLSSGDCSLLLPASERLTVADASSFEPALPGSHLCSRLLSLLKPPCSRVSSLRFIPSRQGKETALGSSPLAPASSASLCWIVFVDTQVTLS